jgi:hypothetical protein
MRNNPASLTQQPQPTTHLQIGDETNTHSSCGSFFGRMVHFISTHKCETLAFTGLVVFFTSSYGAMLTSKNSHQRQHAMEGVVAGVFLVATGVFAQIFRDVVIPYYSKPNR